MMYNTYVARCQVILHVSLANPIPNPVLIVYSVFRTIPEQEQCVHGRLGGAVQLNLHHQCHCSLLPWHTSVAAAMACATQDISMQIPCIIVNENSTF